MSVLDVTQRSKAKRVSEARSKRSERRPHRSHGTQRSRNTSDHVTKRAHTYANTASIPIRYQLAHKTLLTMGKGEIREAKLKRGFALGKVYYPDRLPPLRASKPLLKRKLLRKLKLKLRASQRGRPRSGHDAAGHPSGLATETGEPRRHLFRACKHAKQAGKHSVSKQA